MLFSGNPASFVRTTIAPKELTLAVPLVIFELAFVLLPVWPNQVTVPVHLIVKPTSLVLFTVAPVISTFACDLIHLERAGVVRPVCEFESACAIFLPIIVLSLVHGAIRPCLNTGTVLLVILPIANVLSAICMGVRAFAIGFVFDPFTLVYVPVGVVEFAVSVGFTFAPLALVAGPIQPLLCTLPVPHAVQPLACVYGTRVKFLSRPVLPIRSICIIFCCRYRGPGCAFFAITISPLAELHVGQSIFLLKRGLTLGFLIFLLLVKIDKLLLIIHLSIDFLLRISIYLANFIACISHRGKNSHTCSKI